MGCLLIDDIAPLHRLLALIQLCQFGTRASDAHIEGLLSSINCFLSHPAPLKSLFSRTRLVSQPMPWVPPTHAPSPAIRAFESSFSSHPPCKHLTRTRAARTGLNQFEPLHQPPALLVVVSLASNPLLLTSSDSSAAAAPSSLTSAFLHRCRFTLLQQPRQHCLKLSPLLPFPVSLPLPCLLCPPRLSLLLASSKIPPPLRLLPLLRGATPVWGREIRERGRM